MCALTTRGQRRSVAVKSGIAPADRYVRTHCSSHHSEGGGVITRRDLLILLGVGSFAAPVITRAVVPTYPVHIGLLRFGDRASAADYLDALERGLRDLGYVEGRNLALELRYADGEAERLRGFAAELVKLKVSIIVTTDTPATLAAQRATTTIPIVFATAVDPVGSGLVTSLAQPGEMLLVFQTLPVTSVPNTSSSSLRWCLGYRRWHCSRTRQIHRISRSRRVWKPRVNKLGSRA